MEPGWRNERRGEGFGPFASRNPPWDWVERGQGPAVTVRRNFRKSELPGEACRKRLPLFRGIECKRDALSRGKP